MRIIPNWRRKLLRAYSSHVAYAAVAVNILPEIMPVISDYVPSWANYALLVAFCFLTIVEQPELHK